MVVAISCSAIGAGASAIANAGASSSSNAHARATWSRSPGGLRGLRAHGMRLAGWSVTPSTATWSSGRKNGFVAT